MRGPILVLVALAACDPEPFTIVVSIGDTSLVAYRDGAGEWKPVAPGRFGRARLRITSGRYSLAWSCDRGFRQSYVVHAASADEPQVHCTSGGGFVPLQGVTDPEAVVHVDSQAVQASPEGAYFQLVRAGFHDVVVISSAGDRLLVQRDVDLREGRGLDLPVESRGVPMMMAQAMVSGPPQPVTLSSELLTSHGDHVVLPGLGDLVPVLPDSVLVDSDRAFVRAEGELCWGRVRMSSSPRIVLPEAPAPVVTRHQVTGLSDDWSSIRFEAKVFDDIVGLLGAYTISATGDWMEQADAGGLEIPDLTLVPGFTPTIRPNDLVGWKLVTRRGDSASCETTGDSLW